MADQYLFEVCIYNNKNTHKIQTPCWQLHSRDFPRKVLRSVDGSTQPSLNLLPNRHIDIAIYRLNQPRGRLIEKVSDAPSIHSLLEKGAASVQPPGPAQGGCTRSLPGRGQRCRSEDRAAFHSTEVQIGKQRCRSEDRGAE